MALEAPELQGCIIKYTNYILWSSSLKKIYVGSTNNLSDRLYRHNSGYEKYTSKGIPWILVYKNDFEDRRSAYNLEMKIKAIGIKRYLIDWNIDFRFKFFGE